MQGGVAHVLYMLPTAALLRRRCRLPVAGLNFRHFQTTNTKRASLTIACDNMPTFYLEGLCCYATNEVKAVKEKGLSDSIRIMQ